MPNSRLHSTPPILPFLPHTPGARAKKNCLEFSLSDFTCGDISALPAGPDSIELLCAWDGLFVVSSWRAPCSCFPYTSAMYLKPSVPSKAYQIDLSHSRIIIVELARYRPESSSPTFLSSESIHSVTYRTSFSPGSRGRWRVKTIRSSSGSFTAIFDEELRDEKHCSFRFFLAGEQGWSLGEAGGLLWDLSKSIAWIRGTGLD